MTFFKPGVSFTLNFAHPSVSWNITPIKFSSWKIMCFGQRKPIKVQFSRFLSAPMKVNSLPHADFETTTSKFIQILHHSSVSWKITPLYFCSSDLAYFGQKELIEKRFSDFWVIWWKFTKFLISYLKPRIQFFFKICTLSSVMRDNSSAIILQNIYMIWEKGIHQSEKFQTFDGFK